MHRGARNSNTSDPRRLVTLSSDSDAKRRETMCYSCDLWSAKHKQWFSRRLTQACLGHQTAQASRLGISPTGWTTGGLTSPRLQALFLCLESACVQWEPRHDRTRHFDSKQATAPPTTGTLVPVCGSEHS